MEKYKIFREDCLVLSIYDLNRFNYLEASKKGAIEFDMGYRRKPSIGVESNIADHHESQIICKWRQGDNEFESYVILEKTNCFYGGFRYWFRCPNHLSNNTCCNRRVAKLYLPPGENNLACRHCHNIIYDMQSLSKNSALLLLHKRNNLVKKLDKLFKSTKIPYRNGKPTKKYLLIKEGVDKLQNKFSAKDMDSRLDKVKIKMSK